MCSLRRRWRRSSPRSALCSRPPALLHGARRAARDRGVHGGLPRCATGASRRSPSIPQQVADGREPIDIRDSREGELSILEKPRSTRSPACSRSRRAALRGKTGYQADALADISHQLKTPVTSMMVMTDLLSQGTLDDDKRAEFTRDMRAQLERLRWLITALLKLSRLDAGVVEFERRNVRCGKLIAAALAPRASPGRMRHELTLCVTRPSSERCGLRRPPVDRPRRLLNLC